MSLNLVSDTSVWLDLAKNHRQIPLLEALITMTMTREGKVILTVPQIVIDEFERNRDRVMDGSRASLSSHFKRVKEAIMQFAPAEKRDATLAQLSEVNHRIVSGSEAVSEALDIVESLFAESAPCTDQRLH